MESLARSDVFFIVTTFVVVVIGAILIVGLLYVIMILRSIKRLSKTAERVTEVVGADVAELRQNIKAKGLSLTAFAKFFHSLARRKIFSKSKK